MPDGRRCVRDGGPAQLVRCILQDLCAAAGTALALCPAVRGSRSGRRYASRSRALSRQRGGSAATAQRRSPRSNLAGRARSCPRSASSSIPSDVAPALANIAAAAAARLRSACCSTSIRRPVTALDALRAYADSRPPIRSRRRSNASCRAGAIPMLELAEAAGQVRDAGLTLADIAVSPSVDRQSTPPGSAWPECPPLRMSMRRPPRLPGPAPRRWHVQLFHGAEPQACAGRAARFHHPLHLPDRACRR